MMAIPCTLICVRQQESYTNLCACVYYASMSEIPEFAKLFERYLLASGLTQRQFAKKLVISPGVPPFLIAGKRRPPLEKLDLMCDTLGLKAGTEERNNFQRMAYLDHAPEEVQKMVRSLRFELVQRGKEIALLDQKLMRAMLDIGNAESNHSALLVKFEQLSAKLRKGGRDL